MKIKNWNQFNEALGNKALSKIKNGDTVIYKGEDKNGFIKGEKYKVKNTTSDDEFQTTLTLINGKKTLKTDLVDKVTESKLDEALSNLQKEYREFFKHMLKCYDVTSPSKLSDEKKKEFFKNIKKYWVKGKGATKSLDEITKEVCGNED